MCSSRRWWFEILVEKKTANSLQTMMSMQLMMMLKHNKTWNYQIKWWKHTRNTTSDINGYEHIFVHIFTFFLFFFHFFIFFSKFHFDLAHWENQLDVFLFKSPIVTCKTIVIDVLNNENRSVWIEKSKSRDTGRSNSIHTVHLNIQENEGKKELFLNTQFN